MKHVSSLFDQMIRNELARFEAACKVSDDPALAHFADECRDRLAGKPGTELPELNHYQFVNHLKRLAGEAPIP